MPFKDPAKRREYCRKHYLENKDRIYAYRKKYFLEHPDKYKEHLECCRARNSRYYSNHREKLGEKRRIRYHSDRQKHIASVKKYAKANRAKISIYMTNYCQRNREKYRNYAKKYYYCGGGRAWYTTRRHNKRAGLHNIDGSGISVSDWNELMNLYGYRCAYCNRELSLTMDHVVPLRHNGQHTLDNIVPSCKHCNSSKGTKSLLQYLIHQKETGDYFR